MARKRTYLDYNASAPLLEQSRVAMLAASDLDGNPSSVHAEGRHLRGLIEAARENVAQLVSAQPAGVVFTSGATEANVTVLSKGWDTIFASRIEHDSVLMPARASGSHIVDVPVHCSGIIDLAALASLMATSTRPLGRAVVAIQLANNETGAIQPVAEVAALAHQHGLLCHTDAVQAAGRVPVDFAALGVDSMALSAHKLGGPKGVGALVVRDGVKLSALITGGGQERRRRAGTESVAAIAGFGAAADAAQSGLGNARPIAALRDILERGMLQVTPAAVVFSKDIARLSNTSCIGVPGCAAEILVIKLDLAGFAVSAGSACSSGKVATSHVLAAMGADSLAARGAIRLSLGPQTSAAEIDAFLAAWRDMHLGEPGTWQRPPGNFETSGRAPMAAYAMGDK